MKPAGGAEDVRQLLCFMVVRCRRRRSIHVTWDFSRKLVSCVLCSFASVQ